MRSNTAHSNTAHSNTAHSNISLLILSAVLVLVSASMFESILSWILIMVGCSAVIRAAVFFDYHKHLPTIRTLNLLAALSALGLIYSGLSLDLLMVMLNLLVLACALKVMQVRSQKDVYQLLITLLFLIGCGFIFNQTMLFSVFYSLMTLAILLALACHHGPNMPLFTHLTSIIRLSLQALPIGLLLFLVLPQLPPLWQTPKSKTMEIGLAEQITPGDIANLSQSSDLAFRATFTGRGSDQVSGNNPPTGNVPKYTDRYWRAITMESFDGKTWKIHPARKNTGQRKAKFSPTLSGNYLDYEIMLEPTYQNWLFALDLAQVIEPTTGNIFQSDTFQLLSKQKLISQFQYKVRSYPTALAKQKFTHLDRQLNLSVPATSNPKTRDWVAKLREQTSDDQDFIEALLKYFSDNPFIYTLKPALMYKDPIDQFLFEKQAGFCSHYASALAFSLRLGGIPARLVTGYLGGELITSKLQKPYLSVYQYDAHAWVEMWSARTGWQRIDPTALVSPERVNLGLRQAMEDEGSFLADSPFALARMVDIAWLNNIRLFLADVDYNWSRWILGFNQQNQRDLFKLILGELSPNRLSLLGLAICAIIALLLALFFIPHWLKQPINPSHKYYLKALKLFAQTDIQRANWQGPSAFSALITKHYPTNVAQPFTALSQLYIDALYSNPNSPNNPLAEHDKFAAKTRQKMMRKEFIALKKALRQKSKGA